MKFKSLLILLFFPLALHCQQVDPNGKDKSTSQRPIYYTKLIADKMICNTPFEYMLTPAKPSQGFSGIKFLNLGRTFGNTQPAVAYAISVIDSPFDTLIDCRISHNDGAKIWIDKVLVYEKEKNSGANIKYKERAVGFDSTFTIKLKKGSNRVLIKSETKGQGTWAFYISPLHNIKNLNLSVNKLPFVHDEVADFSNWLVMGPFPNRVENGRRTGLSQVFEPENEFITGKLYTYQNNSISWTLPKNELIANGFGTKLAWGDNNFSWNYHAGGVAWAMAYLGAYTKKEEYGSYSKKYCQFFIDKKPYLIFEKYNLGGMGNRDCKVVESYMLDFTSAPTLPFTYWLLDNKLENKAAYQAFYDEMKNYVVNKQFRLPAGNFARETPHKYTTWADDMYMGIPFLVQASRLATDKKEKKALMEDAVKQLFAFYDQVWDPEYNLYRQTQYSDRKVKIPFWSRANGWGLWATTEVLKFLPKDHPKYREILQQYTLHIEALLKYQDPATGLWHNLIDKPGSYLETSGSAIFTMAMARGINEGWLNKKKYMPLVLKSWKGVEGKIDADGTLHGTCIGTNMSENINDYYQRPVADDDTHGILPVIFAGIEVDKVISGTK